MGVKWLDDKADINKLSVIIRKRTRKGNDSEAYSLTLSKDFKEYIQEIGVTHIRFGWDENINKERFLVLQLNSEELGMPVIKDNGKAKLWLEFTSYYEQYVKDGLTIGIDSELPASIKKGNIIEVRL